MQRIPSPEMTAARSKKAGKKLTASCEMVVNLKGNATITLSNDKGEKVVMNYDAKAENFSMDRTKSGKMDFSKDFAAVTTQPMARSASCASSLTRAASRHWMLTARCP